MLGFETVSFECGQDLWNCYLRNKEFRFFFVFFPFSSLPFPSLPFPSLPFPSLPFLSLSLSPFTSLHFTSLPFPLSLHFTSLHFTNQTTATDTPQSPSCSSLPASRQLQHQHQKLPARSEPELGPQSPQAQPPIDCRRKDLRSNFPSTLDCFSSLGHCRS